jgi:hypothetical protein
MSAVSRYIAAAHRAARLSLAATLLLALPIACSDDPLAPEPFYGDYSLQSVDGKALPAVIFDEEVPSEEGSFRMTVTVVSGGLTLGAGGRYEHEIALAVWIDAGPGAPVQWTDRGLVARSNVDLHFESDLIENVSFTGEVESGILKVEQNLLGQIHDTGRVTEFRFAR